MVKCHPSRMMGEKRGKISDVVKETDINKGAITTLHHETAPRVDLEVIGQLCEYFTVRSSIHSNS